MRRPVGPTWRRILALGVPSLGTILLEPIYTATDSAIMGHVGAEALAALALATGFLNICVVPFTSIGFAITSRAAELQGGSSPTVRDELGVASGLGMGTIGVVVGLVIAALAPFLTPLFSRSTAVSALSEHYLELATLGLPALFIVQAGGSFLTGTGRAKRVFLITFTTVLINVVAEMLLVFGAHLSVVGSALGTDCAQTVGAVLMAFALGRSSSNQLLRHKLWAFFKDFRSAGGALIVRTLALVAAISGAVFVASRTSTVVLGSFQIGQQIWFLFGLSFDAIAIPAQVLVGEWLGSGNHEEIRRWGPRFLRMGLIAGVALGIAVVVARGPLLGLFTNLHGLSVSGQKSIELAGLAMPITALSFVIDGLVGGFQRFYLLRSVMVYSFAVFCIFAVVGLAVFGRSLGVVGVWSVFGAWLIVRGILSYRCWRPLGK